MKKIITIIMMVLVAVTATAFVQTHNGYVLEKEEMASVTNSQIADYMVNEFQIDSYKLTKNKLFIYYNLTYIEPTGDQYKIFTQPKPYKISLSLWNKCLNQTIASVCVNVLINSDTPFIYETGSEENGDLMNVTIKSTYYQAYQDQFTLYESALIVRDSAISNDLEYLADSI